MSFYLEKQMKLLGASLIFLQTTLSFSLASQVLEFAVSELKPIARTVPDATNAYFKILEFAQKFPTPNNKYSDISDGRVTNKYTANEKALLAQYLKDSKSEIKAFREINKMTLCEIPEDVPMRTVNFSSFHTIAMLLISAEAVAADQNNASSADLAKMFGDHLSVAQLIKSCRAGLITHLIAISVQGIVLDQIEYFIKAKKIVLDDVLALFKHDAFQTNEADEFVELVKLDYWYTHLYAVNLMVESLKQDSNNSDLKAFEHILDTKETIATSGKYHHQMIQLLKAKERISDKTKSLAWYENYLKVNKTAMARVRSLYSQLEQMKKSDAATATPKINELVKAFDKDYPKLKNALGKYILKIVSISTLNQWDRTTDDILMLKLRVIANAIFAHQNKTGELPATIDENLSANITTSFLTKHRLAYNPKNKTLGWQLPGGKKSEFEISLD